MAGTWLVRLQGFSNLTVNVDASLLPDGVETHSPNSGTAQLAVFDNGASAFLYLDGSSTPVTLPSGLVPDSAYTLHHVSFATPAGNQVEFAIAGLFDATFPGPIGFTGDGTTNTSLTGMTRPLLSGLLGSHALISMATSGGGIAGEQSNFVYDAVNTCNLNGTYSLTVAGISRMSPSTGPVSGGQTVVFTGSGFTGTTGVTFGGLAATSFTVVSDTQVTAVTPAHATGDVTATLTGVGFSATYTYALMPDLLPRIPRLR